MKQRLSIKEKLKGALAHGDGDLVTFILEAHRTCTSVLKERFPEIAPLRTAIEREEALRSKLPAMLWHDLRRLRILRNAVEHEDFEPDEGDTDITKGTLKNLATFLGVSGQIAVRTPRDWRAFQTIAKSYFERELGFGLLSEVGLELADGQTHEFDLASGDYSVLIECKSYRWTVQGNEPASKLNHAKTDAQLLKGSKARRKILVFEDDLHPKSGKSLAELFARRNSSWLGDVEVWRCLEGSFERIYPSAQGAEI